MREVRQRDGPDLLAVRTSLNHEDVSWLETGDVENFILDSRVHYPRLVRCPLGFRVSVYYNICLKMSIINNSLLSYKPKVSIFVSTSIPGVVWGEKLPEVFVVVFGGELVLIATGTGSFGIIVGFIKPRVGRQAFNYAHTIAIPGW